MIFENNDALTATGKIWPAFDEKYRSQNDIQRKKTGKRNATQPHD